MWRQCLLGNLRAFANFVKGRVAVSRSNELMNLPADSRSSPRDKPKLTHPQTF